MSKKQNNNSGLLGKLMSGENLHVVSDPNLSVSKFDPTNRVLSLPVFKDNEGLAYQGMTIDQVGKARYTPADEFATARHNMEMEHEGMGQVLDIIEQSRTSNNVVDKFPGVLNINARYYSEMWDKDRFGVRDQDINALNFVDKLNLEQKVGHIVRPEFNEAEQEFVKRTKNIRSFEESVKLSNDIIQYLYEEPEEEPPEQDDNEQDDNEQDENDDDSSSDDDNESDDNESEPESNSGGDETAEDDETDNKEESEQESESNNGSTAETDNIKPSSSQAPIDNMPAIQTQSNFNESFLEEVDNSAAGTFTVFVGEPTDPSQMITYYPEVLREWRTNVIKDKPEQKVELEKYVNKFIAENRPIVNHMKQQFDLKKQADSHKRTKQSETGKIDIRKLAFYRTTDNIFKSQTKVRDGKSHGMFMIMDMSGSMRGSRLYATIRQTLLMCMFCKSIQIPFTVFGFTTHADEPTYVKFNGTIDGLPSFRHTIGDVTLREFISSEMTIKQYNDAFSILLRESGIHSEYSGYKPFENAYDMTPSEYLGLTPTIEALNLMTSAMSTFKERNRIEVLNTIVLTDGDCSEPSWFNLPYGTYSLGEKSVVVDTKTKQSFVVGNYQDTQGLERGFNFTFSKIMYAVVKARTDCNLISIRIDNLYEANQKAKSLGFLDSDSDHFVSELNNSGSCVIPYQGCDQYILATDDDIDVSGDLDINNIKNSFLAVAKKKKDAKVLANLILDSVCAKLS